MFRFSDYELDPLRAELRGPDGVAIKLRPKTFEMLRLFAVNAGRVVGKQELLEALWPNVNVGDGSLFQCIKELRAALNDDRRQMIRLASGGGYIFTVDVSTQPDTNAEPARPARRGKPAVTVMPLVATGNDERGVTLAAGATERLIDGLARIGAIRVVAPPSGVTRSLAEPASWSNADFVVQGELQRAERSWVLHTRMIKTGSGDVRSFADVSIDIDEPDARLQQIRLAAGVGHPLARHLNALQEVGDDHEASGSLSSKIVIEQALASNSQTSRERFGISQTMLENAIAAEPDNLDLKLALATLQLRGVQMLWYGPAGRDSIETSLQSIRSLLDYALGTKPNYIPVMDAHCRFLNTTNQFVENLIACAKTLSFDPWNGVALYHLGLAQLHLGRFEEALATFDQAYRFDTPAASRWTWSLGAGWACMLLGRAEVALPWLEKSLAITAASGRTHMLVAAAYQHLGRTSEAKAALEKGLDVRPGSTARNVPTTRENVSPVFLVAADRVTQLMVDAGLPEG